MSANPELTDIVQENLDAIIELCRRYHVKRLEVFGSYAAGDFREDSDVDFLVEFGDTGKARYPDSYFGFLWGLEDLLERQVDLVTVNAVKNPYLRASIDETKRLLYAA